jgi:hypothetical protein
MSLDLKILQKPLSVTESHSDHTWNVALNDYSAYTDIRLVVDIYKNPYLNDMGPNNTQGTEQDSGKIGRLLIPSNEYGNCIFNVETIIRNIVQANPRNLSMVYTGSTGNASNDPYLVQAYTSQTLSTSANTSQATVVNQRSSNISFSNGFNGGYEGFDNIYHINEYRLLFGVQFTSGGTTQQIIPTNYSAYTSYNEITGIISPYSAQTQPYGVMIWPGVQDNKRFGYADNNPNFDYYYDSTNLTGKYNYWNYKVFDWAMDQGFNPYNVKGEFMGTFGTQTIPMTISGGAATYQTRFRTHYYKCPIILPFMYGENPLYDNSNVVNSITFLQKLNNNNSLNYDVATVSPITYTTKYYSNYSYLNQRIAYAVWKQNPNAYTQSDVAIFASSGTCDFTYASGVSEIVQYKMVGEECFNDPISFLFLNRHGVWDTYTFTKKNVKKYSPQRKVYSQYKTLNTKTWNRQSYDSIETVFYGQADELVTVDSNFVQQNDAVVIEELLLSPYVYMMMDNYTPILDQQIIHPYLIPCVVQNKEVKVFEQKYEHIFQYTIELKQTPYRRYELPI